MKLVQNLSRKVFVSINLHLIPLKVREDHSYAVRARELATILNQCKSILKIIILLILSSLLRSWRRSKSIAPTIEATTNQQNSPCNLHWSASLRRSSSLFKDFCLHQTDATLDLGTSWLTVLMKGLLVQHRNSEFSQQMEMKIFITNTDRILSSSLDPRNISYEQQLMSLVEELNAEYGDEDRSHNPVALLLDHRRPPRQHKNPFYGYDETDKLLHHLLATSAVSTSDPPDLTLFSVSGSYLPMAITCITR